jgi:hypothetical protein
MFNDRGSSRSVNERVQQRTQLRLQTKADQKEREKVIARSQNRLSVATIISQGEMYVIELKYVNGEINETSPFTAAQLLKKGAGYFEHYNAASKATFNQLKENQQKSSAGLPSSPLTLSPAPSPRSQTMSSASGSGFYSRGKAVENSNWRASGTPEQGRAEVFQP